MRLGNLFLMLTMSLIVSSADLVATTIDGSANVYERPSLALDKALIKAQKALGADAANFICTEAKSTKRESGGGWAFFFRSNTLNTRFVAIDKSGKVVANNDAYSPGWQFKSAPTLSIEKTMAIASRSKDRSSQWVALYGDWREEPNEWFVYLVNAHRDLVYIYVDSKGKTREQKVKK